MKPSLRIVLSLTLGLGVAAPASAADRTPEIVAELGRINGLALACSYPDIVNRAKGTVIARVAKTRSLGEAFEAATTSAFLSAGPDKSRCPPAAVLNVELEIAARGLAPAAAGQFATSTEMPDVGINPRYLLQAANGKAVTDGDFPDRFQLISFGYTFCPDICPTTLAEMASVLKQLGDLAPRIQMLFISVDPERDTLPQLGTYTAFFDGRILGATGSPALVKRAAENFKVRYEKVLEPGSDGGQYAMDHTAGMYLLAPGGAFLAKFAYGQPVKDVVERIKAEMAARPLPRHDAPGPN